MPAQITPLGSHKATKDPGEEDEGTNCSFAEGQEQPSRGCAVVRSYALLWLVKRNQARLPRRFGPLQPAIAVWKTPSQEGLPASASAQPHQPFLPDGSATPPNVSRGASGDEAPGKVWDRLLVFISITAGRATPAFPSSLEVSKARLDGALSNLVQWKVSLPTAGGLEGDEL